MQLQMPLIVKKQTFFLATEEQQPSRHRQFRQRRDTTNNLLSMTLIVFAVNTTTPTCRPNKNLSGSSSPQCYHSAVQQGFWDVIISNTTAPVSTGCRDLAKCHPLATGAPLSQMGGPDNAGQKVGR